MKELLGVGDKKTGAKDETVRGFGSRASLDADSSDSDVSSHTHPLTEEEEGTPRLVIYIIAPYYN